MFTSNSVKIELDKVITDILSRMIDEDPESEEYATMVNHLVKLYSLRDNTSYRISPDTMATVFGNLFGILIIVGYEQKNVITSKALTLYTKFR